MHSVNRKCSK